MMVAALTDLAASLAALKAAEGLVLAKEEAYMCSRGWYPSKEHPAGLGRFFWKHPERPGIWSFSPALCLQLNADRAGHLRRGL